MRHSLLTSISLIMTLLFVSFHVQADPSSSKHQTPLPLKGERLPVYRLDEWEAAALNESWTNIAHELRVRDLRVYKYPQSQASTHEVEIEEDDLARLKAAKYNVTKISGWYTGFRARRGTENVAGVWITNGSTLQLYWGHVAPITSQSKLDDGLINAVYSGDTDDAKMFLTRGANPYARDYSGDSVLKVAVDKHRVEVTKLLLAAQRSQPSAISHQDVLGALKVASWKGYSEIVRSILYAGITPYQIGIALKIAVSVNAEKVIKVLLPVSSQYDVNEALVIAAFVEEWRGSAIQYPNLVKQLLLRKPSQSALNRAMIAAAQDDEAEIVPVLIAAGADVNAQTTDDDTALIYAADDPAFNSEQPDVAVLLKAGADPNLRNHDGGTPLMRASISNWPATIKLLLAYGADPNIRNTARQNALEIVQSLQKKEKGHSLQKFEDNAQILENAMKQKSNH